MEKADWQGRLLPEFNDSSTRQGRGDGQHILDCASRPPTQAIKPTVLPSQGLPAMRICCAAILPPETLSLHGCAWSPQLTNPCVLDSQAAYIHVCHFMAYRQACSRHPHSQCCPPAYTHLAAGMPCMAASAQCIYFSCASATLCTPQPIAAFYLA